MPTSLAEEALREVKALDMSGVRNRAAYLMGVLKRRVAASDSAKGSGGGGRGRGGDSDEGRGGGKGGKGKGGKGGRGHDWW